MDYENIHQLLNAVELDANLTVAQVADALFKRWPKGVVVIALEQRQAPCGHTEHQLVVPDWSTRGALEPLLVALERAKLQMYQMTSLMPVPHPPECSTPGGSGETPHEG